MQANPLGGLKRGIDRTRIRGQSAQGVLYDLQNAYLTISGSAKKRPPFSFVTYAFSYTKGLFANNGILHTFYTGAIQTSPKPDLIEFHPLQPPTVTPPALQPTTLVKVVFDALFLGKQFVIALFDDGIYRAYWLTEPASWEANTVYNVGDVVQPTTPNGYYYTVLKGQNNSLPEWQAGQVHAIGDKIQPTKPAGYYFTCTNTIGTNPKSGTTEPVWPKATGGVVYEDGNVTSPPPAPPPPGSGGGGNPGGDRYSNLSASGGIPSGHGGTGIKQF